MTEKQSSLEKILKSTPVKIGAAVLLLSDPAFALTRYYKKLLKNPEADTAEEIEFIESCDTFEKLTKEEYADYPDVAKAKIAKLRESAKMSLTDLERAEQIYNEGELIQIPTIFDVILNDKSAQIDMKVNAGRNFVRLCEKAHYLFKEKSSKYPENLEYPKQMTELEEAAIEGWYAMNLKTAKNRYLEAVFPGYSGSVLVFEDAKRIVSGNNKKARFVKECREGYYSAVKKYFDHPDLSGFQIRFYLESAELAPVNFKEAAEKKMIADRLNNQSLFEVFKNFPGKRGDYIRKSLNDYKKAMLLGEKESSIILDAIRQAVINVKEAEKFYTPRGYGE